MIMLLAKPKRSNGCLLNGHCLIARHRNRLKTRKEMRVMKKYKIRPGSIADVMCDILSGLALGVILVYIVYFVSLYA